MVEVLTRAIVGLLSLFLGRRLFWVFVGAAGFLLGFNLAFQLLEEQAGLLLLLIALAAGLLGAALALFAQRLALAIAGFIAGGYLLLYVANLVSADPLSTLVVVILFVVGGLLGAGLFQFFFDIALVLLSSALGATLLTQVIADVWAPGELINALLFILLLVVGIAVQWGLIGEAEARDAG